MRIKSLVTPLLLLTGLILSLGLTTLGLYSLQREKLLQREPIRISVTPTEWEIGTSKKISYKVRYSFQIPSNTRSFSYGERFPISRTNVWAEVPQKVWQDTKDNKSQLPVIYANSDPSINRPADAPSPSNSYKLAIAIGIAGSAAIIFVTYIFIKKPTIK